jgi:hypothetical protein
MRSEEEDEEDDNESSEEENSYVHIRMGSNNTNNEDK